MSFLGKILGFDKEETVTKTTAPENNSNQQVNRNIQFDLAKKESLMKLNLRKEKIGALCLEKDELADVARVALVLDYSGSMEHLYRNGKVQALIDRLLPVAMQLDDNGELEMWIFENGYHRLETISMENYYQYLKNEDILRKYRMGGTNYAPVMKDISNKYLKEEVLDGVPTLVLFVTDGDNFYRDETDVVIKKCSKYPIFWQFIGIGNDSFSYLRELDEMEGRTIDNANFFSVNDLDKISDDELYSRLLAEYPQWVKEAKAKKIL